MIDTNKLKAGRELDALVAEKVMGWTEEETKYALMGGGTMGERAWSPSTDIAAAWEVVEKLQPGKFVWIKDCGGFGWRVEILSSSPTDVQIDCFAMGDTAPLAVCRAALKAVGADK